MKKIKIKKLTTKELKKRLRRANRTVKKQTMTIDAMAEALVRLGRQLSDLEFKHTNHNYAEGM